MARTQVNNNLLRSDVPVGRGGKKGIGLDIGKSKTAKRHRKVLRDNIQGVTKGDIRRLARRGGVKRISGGIYDTVRQAMKSWLEVVLKDVCAVVEGSHPKRKTVATTDVVFILRRRGTPIYGFGNSEQRGQMN
ncbi:Histone H4 [Saxophila tyrrhenica]|uniref:Histone H4 n=1 Tax=Saxophila tyrrhenica TaxID=1690608 RepID=A0AAV9P323_9PEZI|nr:Histone H4 [Saxophila tyrrhenica]